MSFENRKQSPSGPKENTCVSESNMMRYGNNFSRKNFTAGYQDPLTKLGETGYGYQRRAEIPQADKSKVFQHSHKIGSFYPKLTSYRSLRTVSWIIPPQVMEAYKNHFVHTIINIEDITKDTR